MSDGGCKPGCETAPPEDADVAVVMSGSLADLQRAQDRLEQHGIDSEIIRASEDSGGGCCSTKLYLVVARDDASPAYAVFDADWRRGLTDEQIAALEAASSIVVDPDSNEITCPACLTTFEAGPAECPDCGLAIG